MAISVSMEKKYYSKVEVKLKSLNEGEVFYKEMKSSIRSGKNEVYQKRMRETQVFDSSWIEGIESYLLNLDKIVRNPKMVMTPIEDIVRIDRAKKINARSIQHLSSHTQFVQDIDELGRVKPMKVLSTVYEDEIATYENRFIVTLISKLAAFVEKRYDIVKDHMVSDQIDRVNISTTFNWRNFDIECTIDLKVKEDVDDDINRKNKELLERLLLIRKYAQGFMNSILYKEVRAKANFITPPILKTNIILKNTDYNMCYRLWLFLDSYRQLGFDINVVEKNLDLDPEYIDKLYDLVIFNYSAVVSNQEDRAQDYHLQPYKFKAIKQPKIVENLINENIAAGNEKVEEASANEYFYQRTKTQMGKKYEELISSGKGYNQSLGTIFKQMQGISNSVYKDLFEKLSEQLIKETAKEEKKKAETLVAKLADEKKKAEQELEGLGEQTRKAEAEFEDEINVKEQKKITEKMKLIEDEKSLVRDRIKKIEEEFVKAEEEQAKHKDEKKNLEFEITRRKKTVLNTITFLKERDLRNSKAELERLNKKLEKMKVEEAEFKLKLKAEKKLALAQARLDKKKKDYTPEEIEFNRRQREDRKRKREQAKIKKEVSLQRKQELVAAEQRLISQELAIFATDEDIDSKIK